jgi:serine/threonine protein kinase
MDEALVRRLFQQLIMAVDYCHRLGIANRDIKVCFSDALCVLVVQPAQDALQDCLHRAPVLRGKEPTPSGETWMLSQVTG